MHTIFNLLASDHDACDLLFAAACTRVRADDFAAAGSAFDALAELMERHLHIEEAGVFAVYDELRPSAKTLTAALRAEHGQIRGVLVRLGASLAEADRLAFLKHAGTLGLVLQLHNEKEEKVFYPMLETLPDHQRARIRTAVAQEGRNVPVPQCAL